jgi:hypothetical protein
MDTRRLDELRAAVLGATTPAQRARAAAACRTLATLLDGGASPADAAAAPPSAAPGAGEPLSGLERVIGELRAELDRRGVPAPAPRAPGLAIPMVPIGAWARKG